MTNFIIIQFIQMHLIKVDHILQHGVNELAVETGDDYSKEGLPFNYWLLTWQC